MMKKITSLVVALALVAGVFGAVTASAATIEELQAMIASLTQQLAALSGGTTTSTGATTFTSNLSVGSRGAQVSALQETLNTEVDAGLPVTGYFGAMTKAAVIKFQKANGISGTGTVGPLTRAALNALQAPVVVPPTSTTTTPTTPATSGLDQTDGSLTVSAGSYVTTNQTLKKGDVKDVLSVDLKAQTGKVALNRVDVHFNTRPWYLFNKVTLKDSSGTVIAEKTLNSSADVTEVTSGSDYLVRFDGVNVIVEPNVTKTLVVGLAVNSSIDTDRFPTNNQVIVDFGTTAGASGFRSVNGLGYSDTESTTAKSTITLSSTGNKAAIDARLSPSSPIARPVPVSKTQTTSNVVLGIYSLKPENQGVKEITGMNFTVAVSPTDAKLASVSNEMSNFRISDGTTSYGASNVSGGTVTFTNLHIPLTQDVWKDLTLQADISPTSTAFSASSTLDVSTIAGTDLNDNNISINTAADQTASDVTFTNNSMSVSAMKAEVTPGSAPLTIPSGSTSVTVGQSVDYIFTLTNNSNDNLYVSKTPGVFVGTTTANSNASSTLTSLDNIAAVSGDTSSAYVITAGGGSRTFTLRGTIQKSSNGFHTESLLITSINYGTAAGTPTGLSINTGLEQLGLTLTL